MLATVKDGIENVGPLFRLSSYKSDWFAIDHREKIAVANRIEEFRKLLTLRSSNFVVASI